MQPLFVLHIVWGWDIAAMAGITPMDCSGLASEWEADSIVRRKVLEVDFLQRGIGEKWCKPTRENAKNNIAVLAPALVRLRETPNMHLPHISDLQKEVSQLHVSLGKQTTEKSIYQHSVEIKQLLGFIKRRTTHREVTKDLGQRESYSRNLKAHQEGISIYFTQLYEVP